MPSLALEKEKDLVSCRAALREGPAGGSRL